MSPEKENTEESQLPKLSIMQTCPIDFGECKKKEEIENEFNPSQVFLDIPYSGYNKEYEEAIRRAIESFGLTAVLAEKSRKAEGLLCNVCKTIQKSGYAVADISKHNPNVLFELGTLSALGKKYCILCHSDTKIPVDLRGLIINKYRDNYEIEKNVSKWITHNVGELVSRIEKHKQILNQILFQLEKGEISDVNDKINEIKILGDINPLITNYTLMISNLIKFFKDENPNIRRDAAVTLSKFGDTAINPLIRAMKDNDPNVQFSAAMALGKISDVRAVEPLIIALKDKNPYIRRIVAKALGNIGDSKAVEALHEALKDEDSDVRTCAAEALAFIRDKRAIEPLIATLNDNDSTVRGMVIGALGWIGDMKAAEPLLAFIKDDNSYIRGQVAEALGRIGDPNAVESLITAQKDNDPFVRMAVAEALGKIGDGRAVEVLGVALKDEDQCVQSLAAESLGRIGNIISVNILIQALGANYPYDARRGAIKALEEIGDSKAIEPLTALLRDENYKIKESAEWAIEKIKSSQNEKKNK